MRRSKQFAKVVREFNDRGIQWLLESPENLRGFLLTTSASLTRHLDCSQAQAIPTRFIPDDLRKQEADILFRIPYRTGRGKEAQEVYVYILIEHQSKVDPSMGFRLLFYMVEIWDRQRRQWLDEKVPVEEWRFLPIIPIVFYTGAQRWETPLSLETLMELPTALRPFVPHFESLLLKLKETAPEDLSASGHPFGWLLRVLRQEHASEEELRQELELAMRHLAGLAEEDVAAWEKAIYFLLLLIHHRRGTQEGRRLSEKIEEGIRAVRGRRGVERMEQTLAEYWIDQGVQRGMEKGMEKGKQAGALEAQRQILLRLMAEKFGSVPAEVEQRVRALEDTETLDRLLGQVLHAASVQEMGL